MNPSNPTAPHPTRGDDGTGDNKTTTVCVANPQPRRRRERANNEASDKQIGGRVCGDGGRSMVKGARSEKEVANTGQGHGHRHGRPPARTHAHSSSTGNAHERFCLAHDHCRCEKPRVYADTEKKKNVVLGCMHTCRRVCVEEVVAVYCSRAPTLSPPRTV